MYNKNENEGFERSSDQENDAVEMIRKVFPLPIVRKNFVSRRMWNSLDTSRTTSPGV
jgi:hypothetical protein